MTQVCGGCGHPMGEHFYSVDGKARCLHEDHSTSDFLGLSWHCRCDCVGFTSEAARQRQEAEAQQAARRSLDGEAVSKLMTYATPVPSKQEGP